MLGLLRIPSLAIHLVYLFCKTTQAVIYLSLSLSLSLYLIVCPFSPPLIPPNVTVPPCPNTFGGWSGLFRQLQRGVSCLPSLTKPRIDARLITPRRQRRWPRGQRGYLEKGHRSSRISQDCSAHGRLAPKEYEGEVIVCVSIAN